MVDANDSKESYPSKHVIRQKVRNYRLFEESAYKSQSGKFLEKDQNGSKFPLKNRKSGLRLPENRSKKRLKRQNTDGLSSVHLLAVSARRECIHSIGSGNAKKVLQSLSRPRGEIGKHGRLKIY